MPHAHVPAVVLLDQRHRRQECPVVAPRGAHHVEMDGVDEIDDLHVPRQQTLHQRHRPAFERFREQRVVGVVERRAGDLPRAGPRHCVHIDQQAHHFGNGDRGVRVVELDGGMVRQRREVAMLREVPAHEVLQRRRREKELLPEAQFESGRRLVARIEHARDSLEPHTVGQRPDVIATIEIGEPQRIVGARRPQPECVDVAPAPADDRRVVGERGDRLRRMPLVTRRRAAIVDRIDGAAEADRVGDFGPLELPRIPPRQPVLRQFMLPAVLHHLTENAMVVADAVTVRGDRQRGHAFHEARREPPEPAIAQRRVRLDRAQPFERNTQFAERVLRRRGEPEVAERVHQQASDQELERQVVDALPAVAVRCAGRLHPAVDGVVAYGERGRDEPVVIAGVAGILAHRIRELVEDQRAEGLDRSRLGRGDRAPRAVGGAMFAGICGHGTIRWHGAGRGARRRFAGQGKGVGMGIAIGRR